MQSSIEEQLAALAEPAYQKFSSGLLPGVSNILGVRLPLLRKLAKTLVKGDWRAYLQTAQNRSMEETMLQGMVIGYAKADMDELLAHVAAFVPKIDNWSVCDSFCTGLTFVRSDRERVWQFLQPYLVCAHEYRVRFAVVMLLFHYMDEVYIDRVLTALASVRHEGYYARMAVAWALSICYVHFPAKTMRLLHKNTLDTFTYNKALQKITESHRVPAEDKARIRSMRRREEPA